MKKVMPLFFIVIAVLLIAWTAASYFLERSVASPDYRVVAQKDGYEIRQYEPLITAQVQVEGSYDEALNKGFRILADYIFGNNTKQASIAMTAPVTERQDDSEKIAMTAPVMVREDDAQTRIVSFVMPSEYTLETLPQPNNPDVKIVQQEARTVAVLRFSWFRGADRVMAQKQKLIAFLERDGVSFSGSPEYAGYDAPFTAPWLHRNEVMVELE